MRPAGRFRMSAPTRPSVPQATGEPDAVPREALVDRLLVAGLDQYFAGDYERAIHTWTRVLFLDRGHTRARAYIDRARRVLNERQREAEELSHTGIEALESGDQHRARALLAAAYDRNRGDEGTLLALQRLDRLEAAALAPTVPAPPAPAAGPVGAPPAASRQATWWLAIAAAVVLLAAVVVALTWDRLVPFSPAAELRSTEVSPAVAQPAALPLPSTADLVLARARALSARGHLHEALRLVETIGPGDQRRAEADELRAELQRTLIAAVSTPAQAGGGPPASRAPAPAGVPPRP
jgi:hypothetical protein